MSEIMSDDDDDTVIMVSATLISISSCVRFLCINGLEKLRDKGAILCACFILLPKDLSKKCLLRPLVVVFVCLSCLFVCPLGGV